MIYGDIIMNRTRLFATTILSVGFAGMTLPVFASPFDYSNPHTFSASESISGKMTGQKLIIDGSSATTVTVEGEGTALVSVYGLSDTPGGPGLSIGVDNSNNTLDILSGGQVYAVGSGNGNAADAVIGYNTGSSNNVVNVNGAGASFVVSAEGTELTDLACVGSNCPTLYVGRNGANNALNVANGGYVGTGQMRLGDGSNSSGNTVLVDGVGSRLDVLTKLKIGQNGDANGMNVTNGAQVYVNADESGPLTDGYTSLGYRNGSNDNYLNVSGTGSLFATSNLYIGSDSTLFSGGGGADAEVNIYEGAELRATNVYLRNESVLYVDQEGLATINGLLDGDATSQLQITQNSAIIFGENSVGTNTIGGLALDSGSTMSLYAKGSASNEYTHFDITDGASIAGSAFINVESGTTFADSILSGVIDCDGCDDIGNFSSVTDNSLAYNFSSVANGDGTIDIIVSETGVSSFSEAAQNTPYQGAGNALDNLLASNSEAMEQFYDINSAEEATEYLEEAVSNITLNISQAISGNQHTVNDIIDTRLSAQSGMASGDDFATDGHFWLKGFGSWADQGNRNGVTGYDARTGGMAVGADRMVSEKTRLGAALVYSHTNVDSNNNLQSSSIDGYQGFVYGSYSLDNRTNVNMKAGLGLNSADTKRTIAFAGLTALSDYDSTSQYVGASFERKYALDAKTTFVPSLRADYLRISTDSFNETGAGIFNLNVDDNSAEELVIGLDGTFSRPVTNYLTLSANAGVGYDLLSERSAITSNFAGGGGAFVTQGIDLSPWIGSAGVGAILTKFDNVDLSARYDLEARSEFTQQTASLKLRLPF